MKTQFILKFSTILMIFILTGFISLTNAIDKEKTFTVSKGDKLEVLLSNGNIKINTWDKSQAYIKAYNVDEDDLQQLKIEQQGNKVLVDFKGGDSEDFYLEVSIPAQFNIELATGGGNVDLNGNITGSTKISTGGGNISTLSLNGPTNISTGGGNIKIVDIGGKLSVSTGGGDVSVGVVNGETEISTGGGSINIKEVKSKVEVSTGGGNVTIGNINGTGEVATAGGNISVGKVSGSVELSTAGGNISLNGASGKVEVATAGGNISLKNISGSIKANTAGGNIWAELNPDGISQSELNTAGGDINLILPSNAKATVIATVHIKKHLSEAETNELIKSDFEVTTVDLNSRNLTKRFSINGGGSVIEMNTASGKITINKK